MRPWVNRPLRVPSFLPPIPPLATINTTESLGPRNGQDVIRANWLPGLSGRFPRRLKRLKWKLQVLVLSIFGFKTIPWRKLRRRLRRNRDAEHQP